MDCIELEEPQSYDTGLGQGSLPFPKEVLLFSRTIRQKLQQEALQDRSHHRFVLIFNHKTDGVVHVDNLELSLRCGQALLIHPYQFHHFSHLASVQLNWLFFTFEMEEALFLEPLRNRVVAVGQNTRSAWAVLLEEWLSCAVSERGGEFGEMLLQLALLRVLIFLRQDLQATSFSLPNESEDSFLRTVNRLLSEWRGGPVVVADLAEAMGVSISLLRIRFKEVAGVPIGYYIQNYRLSRAMEFLRTPGFSIADVAREAGFGSPQAFSRIFKKATGMTPRAYRQRV